MNDLEKALNVCNAINNDLADIVNNHDLMAIVAKTLSDKGDASIRQLLKFTDQGSLVRSITKEYELSKELDATANELSCVYGFLEQEREANKHLFKKHNDSAREYEHCYSLLKNIIEAVGVSPVRQAFEDAKEYIEEKERK